MRIKPKSSRAVPKTFLFPPGMLDAAAAAADACGQKVPDFMRSALAEKIDRAGMEKHLEKVIKTTVNTVAVELSTMRNELAEVRAELKRLVLEVEEDGDG